ncbi:MAG: DUF4011 domain-containing protein [Deltaproteobacteria bacterium]|nr:DUF4011 domain-containing protein [Deltaproteobacteria bacterium]
MSEDVAMASAEKRAIDVERFRFRGEPVFADSLLATGIFNSGGAVNLEKHDSERIRRRLLTTHVKLSENMAPDVFEYAKSAAGALGLDRAIEIYQASGEARAANFICPDVVFISLQGQWSTLLDRGSFIALFGHEFGHHLAHTNAFAQTKRRLAMDFASAIAWDHRLPDSVRVLASRVSMAMEFTADRFAALATGSLDDPIRLMMAMVTGLPAERLAGDAPAYIEQAKVLFGETEKAETEKLGSHPEHLLRAYALLLFSETDAFCAATGRGPGTRTLADVDDVLETILGGSAERFYETQDDGTPAPEIQEFALCAASLVAMADDSLDDTETKALEDTFSTVVPGWKDLLDGEKALARFGELLPVAIAGGEPVAASVFNIMMHVILADREIHVRELDVLAAVGRSLQQEHLFRYLLTAAARALKIERVDRPVERPLPSLPPGKFEARTALAGLFAGLARRGGGAVGLRRLARILGKASWDETATATIESSVQEHRLEVESPPVADADGAVRLDQSLVFRLTQAERKRREDEEKAARARGLAEVKTRDALAGALKHLRERLVSGDGRSPSVRLYKAVTGRHFDLASLDRIIDGRSERIVALLWSENVIPLLSGDEAGLHKVAADTARTLRNLDREFRARVEETGCRDLFVGYPFLVGNVGGFFVRAPLVLHPYSLVSDARGAGTYVLRRRESDPAIANQALIRLLFAKKNYAFTDELAQTLDEKAAVSAETLLDALRDLGLDAKPLTGTLVPFEELNVAAAGLLPEGIALAENAIVGFFPQSSSDLLQDYDELLQKLDPSSATNLETSLNAACDILPASYRPEFRPPALSDSPDQPIVYSDPSQREAVLRSRAARLMVMDGPPGTGKSQTIVNLVADALAKGQRVAIVCEKRVALDVVKQRMDGAGIGHLAAVVHDVHDDRKALYTHVADRLEASDRRRFSDAKMSQFRAEIRDIEDQLATRDRILATPTLSGLAVGQLHTMAASIATPPVALPDLASIGRDDLRRLTQMVKDLHPYAGFWTASSPYRSGALFAPRASFAGISPADLQSPRDRLARAAETAAIRDRLHVAMPVPYEGLEEADGERAAAAAESTRVQIDESTELTEAVVVAGRLASSFFRFLRPSWRKAKRIIRNTLVRQWPEQAKAKIRLELVAALERRIRAARAWRAAESALQILRARTLLPRDAGELLELIGCITHWWDLASKLAISKRQLERVDAWPIEPGATEPQNGWLSWISRCGQAVELADAFDAAQSTVAAVAATFPHAVGMASPELARLRDAFGSDAHRLVEADRVLTAIASLYAGATSLAEGLADGPVNASPSDWADAVRRGWAEAWLAQCEDAMFDLRILDQAPPMGSLEQASARLLELHQAIAREEAERIAVEGDRFGLMAVNPAEPRARRTPEQTVRETIVRECRKQRNVMPMRTLVRRYAREGLLDIVPVWLMSPETTAILFPREPIFDLLIIDEASQCTVENGFPVLTRARRAVIAGDDKQMPPTSFFKAASGIEADESDETDRDVPLDVFESESLLVLARNVGVGAPLRWHYRALFEELIAFSNHSMYGGSLLTIPATLSRSAPPAVRWVRVPDGVWAESVNLPEAKRVVDVVGEILLRPDHLSVGVVTFNISQRRAILDEIDVRRSADAAFARVYDAAASAEQMDARPFVKNLEGVQGDERDVIVFSLGYAPTIRKKRDGSEETYVPARFGPLGQKGGERRLNVAVSRAKVEVVVVSSFDPSMLSVANTRNDGPRLFKAFVEFAHHMGEGRRNQAEKILSLVNDQTKRRVDGGGTTHADELYLPLHHQIALDLEKAGLPVETTVGTSEFRLPVAVVHGDDSRKYSLAVLCDDGGAPTHVYEKYVHVPNVLNHRRWRHLRVTAREWHRDRVRVIERIRQASAG